MKVREHRCRPWIAALVAIAFTACAPAEKKQTSGEFIDDAWITSKVKGAFVKDPQLSAAQIKVDTYQGEVQLSGFVADAGNVGKAAAVAGGVKGVRSVRNDILVKK